MKYDAFLSHASEDKPAVERIARKLLEAGLSPFLDKWHLVPGEPWQEALEQALDDSATCVVFVGQGGVSPWENEEMRAALEERVKNDAFRVIPVLLPDAVRDRETVPRFLRRLTWCDFGSGLEDPDAFRNLLAGIRGEAPGSTFEARTLGRPSTAPSSSSLDRALGRLGAAPFAYRRRLVNEAVRRLTTSPLPLILRGLPGIGKTTLLCQAAREVASDSTNVVAIGFEGPVAVEPSYAVDELKAFLSSMGRKVDESGQWGAAQGLKLEMLIQQFVGLDALVLLDAVDAAPSSLREALLLRLGAIPGVRIAATVQREVPTGITAQVLTVPPLSRPEAASFVRELASALHVTVDPERLLERIPMAVAGHPEALATLMGHLQDLPLELLLAAGLPEDARGPGRLLEQALEALDDRERTALAFAEVLSGVDMPRALPALRLSLPPGFSQAAELMLSRSLIYRSGDAFVVPGLVAEALANVSPLLRKQASTRITTSLQESLHRTNHTEDDAEALAVVAAHVASHLSANREWQLVGMLTESESLELFNLRGHWKEYAVLLRVGIEATDALADREKRVELGCRLARKLPQMGDLTGARDALLGVERAVGAEGETLEHAELYSHRAYLSALSGHDQEALSDLLRSRDIRELHGDSTGLVVVHKLLGNLHLRARDYRSARAAYEAALAERPEHGQFKHRFEAEISLALCDLADGDAEVAESHLRDVLRRMGEVRYKAGMARATLNLALVVERRGRAGEAVVLARRAADHVQGNPAVTRAATALAIRLERQLERSGVEP